LVTEKPDLSSLRRAQGIAEIGIQLDDTWQDLIGGEDGRPDIRWAHVEKGTKDSEYEHRQTNHANRVLSVSCRHKLAEAHHQQDGYG